MGPNLKSKKHLRVWLLAGYAILLAISHLVRQNSPAEVPLTENQHLACLQAIDDEQPTKQKIQLAFRDFSAAKDSLPVLILLHGSPMGSETFDDLGPALGKNFRVIVPDLPGFGASSAFIPDYAIRAHAKYILHGMRDELVPLAVAAEHHRLVPQSELKTYATGHGLAFMRWHWIVPDISHFVDDVEAGKARTRLTAEPQRLAAA